MLKRSLQMSQRITPLCRSDHPPTSHVLQQLVADGVVRGERGGVRGGGLGAGSAAVGFQQQHRLLHRHFLGDPHEGSAVAEALKIRPGLV